MDIDSLEEEYTKDFPLPKGNDGRLPIPFVTRRLPVDWMEWLRWKAIAWKASKAAGKRLLR